MHKVTRIISVICMMGLLTFVSTSCKKNQETGEMTITVTMPSIENDGDRAYINEYGTFFWHENDYIRVYNLAEEANAVASTTAVYSKIGNASTQTTHFRGPKLGAKKAEGFRYFYPINMVKGTSSEIEEALGIENRQTFTISDHQYFHSYADINHHYSMVDPSAMPMYTQVDKLSDNFTLHHLFGVAAFNLSAAYGTTVVVDSVMLEDNFFNITGDVSLKLHKVCFDDSQGSEHNLNNVWNEFMNYQGVTPEYVTNVLDPELEWLGWDPDNSTLGHSITLDCIYEHDDGEVKGVTLDNAPNGTYFHFMLRPFALSQGFTLTVYVHDGEPIVLSQDDFEYNGNPCDYTWGVKPGKRKTYVRFIPIN